MLSTCAFSAINSNTACIESLDAEIRQSMNNLAANLSHLNATSSAAIISCAQLELEAGSLVSELCSVRFAFKSIGLTLNEFVALKVIAMTSIIAQIAQGQRDSPNSQAAAQVPQPDIADPAAVLAIRDRYLKALVSHLSHKKPPLGSGSCSSALLNGSSSSSAGNGGPLGPHTAQVLARINSLLSCLGQVSSAANLLLQSKMFYVPFLMNSSSITHSAAATNGHYSPGLASHPSPPVPHHFSAHLGHLNQAAAAAAVAVAAANLHHHQQMSYEHRNGSSMPNGAAGSGSGNSGNSGNGGNGGNGSRSASSSPPTINGVVLPPSSMANGPTSNGTAILASGGAMKHEP